MSRRRMIRSGFSRANADDRLSRPSLLRVEGADSIVEARDFSDIGPQPSVPYPLSDLGELGAISLDDEVDHPAIGGSNICRSDDGHQRSASPDQRCRPLLNVSADDIEYQIDTADIFELVAPEVDELIRAEVERLLSI